MHHITITGGRIQNMQFKHNISRFLSVWDSTNKSLYLTQDRFSLNTAESQSRSRHSNSPGRPGMQKCTKTGQNSLRRHDVRSEVNQ